MGAKPAATIPNEVTLHSVRGAKVVQSKPVPAASVSVVAIDLFGNFLVNSSKDAKEYGNVLVGWDQIPKFSADHLNNKDGIVPNDHTVNFHLSGQEGKLTLFPGTYYPKKDGQPMRRFTGVKEQQVEQALIHHATMQSEEQTVDGKTSYFVTFTINALRRQLQAMGSTMSNAQIRHALEVLSSSVMTIQYGGEQKFDKRAPILPSFDRNHLTTSEGNNGDDLWRVQLHQIVVESILKVTYRQYPIGQLKDYSPVGAALLRRLHYIANVSESVPYKFTVSDMKLATAGLTHVRLSGSMNAICKELDRMIEDNYLVNYTVDDIFPVVRGRGRPVPIDYRFTLFAGPQWIKNVKAGSLRQSVTEQRLGLPRSKREERHQQMMLI